MGKRPVTPPKKPSRIHLRGDLRISHEDRQLIGAVGGKKAQAMGKGLRFSGARARELGRKGGLVRPVKAIKPGDGSEGSEGEVE